MEEIEALDGLPERAEIEHRLRRAEAKFAQMELRRRGAVFAIGALSAVFLFYYAVLVIPAYLAGEILAHGIDERLGGHPVSLIAGVVISLLLAVTATLVLSRIVRGAMDEEDDDPAAASRANRTVAGVLAGLAAALGLAVLSGVYTWTVAEELGGVSPYVYPALLVMAWFATFALTAAATWMVIEQTGRLYRTRTAAAWPESTAIHELASILIRLHRTRDERWLELEDRRAIVEDLERAATCIECHLPGKLRHDDAGTDRWLRGQTQMIAGSLRELKREVCLPQPGAREEVARRVSAALVHAARGDWNAMAEGAQPALAETKPPLSRRALALRAAAGVAVLAALVLDRGNSPAALAGFAGEVFHELNALVGPLLVPTLGYGLLKLVNPAILENLPAIRKLGQRDGS
jgi:hypothetical protein